MPAKKPAPPGTLAFLSESGKRVYVVCDNCDRITNANLYKIAQSARWRARASEVAKRLRCTACRHRGAKLTFDCLRPFGL